MGLERRVLGRRGMNQVFFSLRRAFHTSNRFLFKLVEPFGITPARLDLLHAIEELRIQPRQTQLAKLFGVTAATMSKLVRAIERLGLIARERDPRDARAVRISLTDAGLKLLRRARRAVMGSGAAELAAVSAVTYTWWDANEAFCQLETFVDALCRLRRQFGDQAWFYYAWHPDDFQ